MKSEVLQRPRQQLLSPALITVASLALLAALLVHAYIGTFSRYVADDYCTASVVRSHGFWSAQAYWFNGWTGRFSFTMAVSIAHFFGPSIVRILPCLVLLSWLAALTWTIFQTTSVGMLSRRSGFLLAEIVIFSTLATTPAIYQSLYWTTGALTYVMPLAFSTAYMGLLIRIKARGHSPGTGLIVVGGLLTLIGSGFSEVHAAFQAGLLFVAVAACGASRAKRGAFKGAGAFLLAGLVGAAIGSSILIAAPGNGIRIAGEVESGLSTAPSHSATNAMKIAVHFTLDCLNELRKVWPVPASVFAMAGLLALCCSANGLTSPAFAGATQFVAQIFMTAVIAGFLVVVCFLPPAYVASYMRATYYPPARLFVIPQFVVYCSLCVAGFVTGMTARPTVARFSRDNGYGSRAAFAGALGLILIVALSWVGPAWNVYPIARTFAAAWDERDTQIWAAKRAGAKTVRTETLPSTDPRPDHPRYFGLRLMDKDANNWVNQCAAEFYGLDAIVVD